MTEPHLVDDRRIEIGPLVGARARQEAAVARALHYIKWF